MKRFLIVISVLVIACVGLYLYLGTKHEKPSEKTQPIRNANNSAAFNTSFEKMLGSYYSLKDALVASDTVAAAKAASELQSTAAVLDLKEIDGDSTGLIRENAKSFASTISNSASMVASAANLEAKRKEFETITDPLWNLIRTVRYNEQQVYYQYCPMAFDDRGAYWLSRESAVLNPYFGERMLRCGSVEDSLRF